MAATPVQCELLDELVARVWDAAYAMPKAEALISVAQAIDVGGNSQPGCRHRRGRHHDGRVALHPSAGTVSTPQQPALA